MKSFSKKLLLSSIIITSILSCSKDDGPQLSPAEFSADVSTLDFGEVEINQQRDLEVTVSNTGEQDLVLESFTLSGTNVSDFVIDEVETVIESDKSYIITVAFAPTSEGAMSAKLTVKSNVGEHQVTLTGSATPEPKPVFNISSESLNFGNINIGTIAVTDITISNTGNADLEITEFVLEGNNSDEFSTDGNPSIISATNNYVFNVEFIPVTEGDKTANLKVITNAGVFNLPLAGKALPEPVAIFTIDPENHNYGDVEVNTSIAQSFTISNTGNAPLTISEIVMEGTNSSEFNSSVMEANIEANANSTFNISFAPTSVGAKNASFRIVTNVGEYTINLEGNAIPERVAIFTVDPESFDYGDVGTNSSSTHSFTISNTGDATLSILGIVNQGDVNDFKSSEIDSNIPAGQTNQFTITFSPTSLGNKTASFKFSTNVGEYSINVSGNGSAPVVNIPDPYFKVALLDHGVNITGQNISLIDTNNDGEIQITEAQAYDGVINCESKGIVNITGIEEFINITELNISRNQITALNVSKNIKLSTLNCAINKISNLSISNNPELTRIFCMYNRLSSLDISVNHKVVTLYANNNRLTRLNVANSYSGLTWMFAHENPNLSCIKVSSNHNTQGAGWRRDATARYSTNCQ